MCQFECFESLLTLWSGTNEDGAVFRGWCGKSSPYHPQGDGQVEKGGSLQLSETMLHAPCSPLKVHQGNFLQRMEWLEGPVPSVSVSPWTYEDHEISGNQSLELQAADTCQPEVSRVNNESIHEPGLTPMRLRHEQRELLWLQDYVRTVSVYPTWPFNCVGTVTCLPLMIVVLTLLTLEEVVYHAAWAQVLVWTFFRAWESCFIK